MKYYVNENAQPKLPVRFSPEIDYEIDTVCARNINNDEGLIQFAKYIEGLKKYISNPVIAWDNMDRYYHHPNGETYLDELGYDIGFIIKEDDENKTYVYVFYLNLNLDDFGLCESRRKNIIRLTSSDLKRIITESVQRILQEPESKVDKVLGEYNVLDGMWWDGQPHGLESKGNVQDVRMYDKRTNGDSFETIALFRRCDNLKYFYARIIPINSTKETKWEPIPLNEVPNIIRKDIYTINPQGHEPYLRF